MTGGLTTLMKTAGQRGESRHLAQKSRARVADPALSSKQYR
jgi:hypothetical protein